MITNINHARRSEVCENLEAIADKIKELIEEARHEVREHPSYDNWDAYVFRNLEESVENVNPYNQSLWSIIYGLNIVDKTKAEPIEAWGEGWDEEDDS